MRSFVPPRLSVTPEQEVQFALSSMPPAVSKTGVPVTLYSRNSATQLPPGDAEAVMVMVVAPDELLRT